MISKFFLMKFLIILYFADTPVTDIEETLKKFIKRDDIDIILINQNVRIFEFLTAKIKFRGPKVL